MLMVFINFFGMSMYVVHKRYVVHYAIQFLGRTIFMLIKNKWYFGSIITLFLIDLILVVNENFIASSIGERLFYITTSLIFILIFLGAIKKSRH